MQLTGIHHLTAITAQAANNYSFYTLTLGLRLVKKTVNQDDVSAYHLFYADGLASPGTDMTFFDWSVAPEKRGTQSIVRTAFRVKSVESLDWWSRHLTNLAVKTSPPEILDGRPTLDFEDVEGQRLRLVVDQGGAGNPWEGSPIPVEHQILGLGPITLSVARLAGTDLVLREVMNMRNPRSYEDDGVTVQVYEMGEGGPAAELHVRVEPDLPVATQGAGGVHHVAFRTPDEEQYRAWVDHLKVRRIASSGAVDRYYFRSLYFREPNGILFEIATDGPGFATDEPMESLGQSLSLPPFLEPRRKEIEAGLKPLST